MKKGGEKKKKKMSLQIVSIASFVALLLSLILSPAFLVHGRDGLWCNLLPCNREVKGRCHKDFELVRKVFQENLEKKGETGGAVAVYLRGELVVDIWGGEWSQFTKAKLRSNGGLNLIACALLVEDGFLHLTDHVVDVWPGFVKWIGGYEVTIGDILTQRFKLETEEKTNHLRASQGRATTTTRTVIKPSKDVYGYYPYITDVVVNEIVPLVDPMHRSLERFIEDRIVTKLDISKDSVSFTEEGGSEPSFLDWGAVAMRAFTNVTDSWCGPLPLRGLWESEIFSERKHPGFAEYLTYQSAYLGKPLKTVDITAASLARIYSGISVDHPGSKDIGHAPNHELFSSPVGVDCASQKPTPEASLDMYSRNVSRSPCGFSLSTESDPLFSLKEAQTHGRRWMHFAWSGLGGSYVAVSVGHGVSIVYLTNREGMYEKDPRANGVVEAVNEVVYWKEMDEFTQDLKKRGLSHGGLSDAEQAMYPRE
eukprot:TRINITY_DN10833_c0_g1_i1.p1 TRINITY_DN10833_c0_g1~~TRINITY_DN10833_c0_g1_i1.p1  ORF type:complete len:480 (+),score=49.83 TRINITY_DN10833_c0_g1_i1:207-1646(+)